MEVLKGHIGHILDMDGSWSTDLFTRTLKQIGGHVRHTYQHGGDIQRAVKTLTQSHLPPPVLGGGGADPVSQAIFQEQEKEYIKHSNKLEENLKSLWRQSSDAIQS